MTRTNTRLSGEILKLAKNVQDLASAFNGNVHSVLRQQRDDREQLHAFYGNMEKALAGVLGRLDALERNGLPKVDRPPLGELKGLEPLPLPRFYVDEAQMNWGSEPTYFIRDRVRKARKSPKFLTGPDAVLTRFLKVDTSVGAARAAAKEYCAWLNKMEDDKSGVAPAPSPVVKTQWRNVFGKRAGQLRSSLESCGTYFGVNNRTHIERVDTHADGSTTITKC